MRRCGDEGAAPRCDAAKLWAWGDQLEGDSAIDGFGLRVGLDGLGRADLQTIAAVLAAVAVNVSQAMIVDGDRAMRTSGGTGTTSAADIMVHPRHGKVSWHSVGTFQTLGKPKCILISSRGEYRAACEAMIPAGATEMAEMAQRGSTSRRHLPRGQVSSAKTTLARSRQPQIAQAHMRVVAFRQGTACSHFRQVARRCSITTSSARFMPSRARTKPSMPWATRRTSRGIVIRDITDPHRNRKATGSHRWALGPAPHAVCRLGVRPYGRTSTVLWVSTSSSKIRAISSGSRRMQPSDIMRPTLFGSIVP